MSHPTFMVFNPIFSYVSPNIMIFQELLIIETQSKCHWILHALNPKYAPLKQFWCIFPVENFCLKLWFFRNWLLQRHKTCGIGFGMPQTINTCHSKPFQCIFPSQNKRKCEILAVSWTPPDKKLKKCQLEQGKSVQKGLQICTYRLLGMPIAMHLC